jgi:hypothetical protein
MNKFNLPLLSVILFVFFRCGPSSEKIVFPENLKTYQVTDSIPFNPGWIDAKKKLVVVS